MNSIATHVEFLLRQHDCVVVPGLGAFLCNYAPAHFDASNDLIINPPGRSLAFNPLLSASDGLLASSFARKDGISYENATRRLAMAVENLLHELDEAGELAFGRLGTFYKEDGGLMQFTPNAIPSLNGFFYGLRPISAIPLDTPQSQGTAPYASAVAESAINFQKRNWRVYATGVAASLALIVTLAMFIMSPIKVNKPIVEASIAPVATEHAIHETACTTQSASLEEASSPCTGIDAASHPEKQVVDNGGTTAEEIAAVASNQDSAIAKPSEAMMRFNNDDPFCVIVASFPSKAQAELYMQQHATQTLGILEKDNKFRIYSATATTFKAANEQKTLSGHKDAWVCRR